MRGEVGCCIFNYDMAGFRFEKQGRKKRKERKKAERRRRRGKEGGEPNRIQKKNLNYKKVIIKKKLKKNKLHFLFFFTILKKIEMKLRLGLETPKSAIEKIGGGAVKWLIN